MKNRILPILIFLTILISSLQLNAQNDTNEVIVVKSEQQIEEFSKSLGLNELKIDFFDLLIFPALTIGYEKTNDSSSAFGATLFLNLNSDNSGWNDKFVITPYYRFYFSKSEDFGSKGFFAEVFSKFAFGESTTEDYFDIAPGIAVGNKWINRKGFTFEILFGLGRNLLYDSDEYNNDGRSIGISRAGVAIGKRF
jgi:hypothetical protein